ncbi:hypothetical protein ARMGADRAFT_1168914 [Armillaria gallica]|uniref:Uncharacterized protein n=1 Tax=Armillaria gallica TaxID=47427 RepID=A0A2H3CYZ4_ARMGA|nr:hypothetical protein ARMGADRAFT_1168914 [Armillaria gallica]
MSESPKLTYMRLSRILFLSVSSFLIFLGTLPALRVLILDGDVCIENPTTISQVQIVRSKSQLDSPHCTFFLLYHPELSRRLRPHRCICHPESISLLLSSSQIHHKYCRDAIYDTVIDAHNRSA